MLPYFLRCCAPDAEVASQVAGKVGASSRTVKTHDNGSSLGVSINGDESIVIGRRCSALLEAVESGELGGGASTEFDDESVTRMDPNAMSQLSAAEDALGKVPCPKCGVVVAPGYPNCPRCKSSLIEKSARTRTKAGGTSLGEADE